MTDDSAPARFGHLRGLIADALQEVCPNGHRICLFIAEPDGRIAVLSDWQNPFDQLVVLRTLVERLESELLAQSGGPDTIVH